MTDPARPCVTVVGLGPAGAEYLSAAALDAIAGAERPLLRTSRHPAAGALAGRQPMTALDSLYEESASFEDVYRAIVERVVHEAVDAHSRGTGPVVYAVPGSPLVAERTVELLRADDRVTVTIVPALSFLDLAWARLGIDPVTAGVRLVDATAFAATAAGERGPLLVAQCWSKEILSTVKLSVHEESMGPEPEATVLHHLGLPDEQVVTVGWWEIDRVLQPDHLTSLWVPRLAAPIAGEVARVEELVRTLRRECPWDREQTHASLTAHLLEESYEAIEALEALGEALDTVGGPPGEPVQIAVGSGAVADACEELGDVLFQVVFHSVLASEEGLFTLADVAHEVHRKLVSRHPHVFGDVVAETPDAVAANWEVLKKAEKGRTSVTDGIPLALPALVLAGKLQRKAAALGIGEASVDELRARVSGATELLGEPGPSGGSVEPGRSGDGAGPVGANRGAGSGAGSGAGDEPAGVALMALAELAQRSGIDPEAALRHAAMALRDRIVAAEGAAGGA
jgi:tetrapyrrole methylase family protein/MazG family protein